MTPVVSQLLFLNVIAYLLIGDGSPVTRLYAELALIPSDVLQRPWTVITYQFLHGGGWHLIFNMVMLFFLGPRLEVRLGSRHFLALYLISGSIAPFVHILASNIVSGQAAALVGASGAIYGIMFGYVKYWPRDRVMVWFVIPVEIRFLVIFLTVVSLTSGLGGARDGIAHFAHLGGFAGGWLYLRWKDLRSPAREFQKKVESPALKMRESELTTHWQKIDPSTLHPVNREEYDRISDKIRSLGWAELTDREKTFVERFGGGLS